MLVFQRLAPPRLARVCHVFGAFCAPCRSWRGTSSQGCAGRATERSSEDVRRNGGLDTASAGGRPTHRFRSPCTKKKVCAFSPTSQTSRTQIARFTAKRFVSIFVSIHVRAAFHAAHAGWLRTPDERTLLAAKKRAYTRRASAANARVYSSRSKSFRTAYR